MEVKKKFFNRVGAFVCALVVLVGCLGGTTNYYADAWSEHISSFDWETYKNNHPDMFSNEEYVELYSDLCKGSCLDGYYNLFLIYKDGSMIFHIYSTSPVVLARSGNAIGYSFGSTRYVRVATADNLNFVSNSSYLTSNFQNIAWLYDYNTPISNGQGMRYLYSDYDVLWSESGSVAFTPSGSPIDVDLGYLQDVRLTNAYTSGVLGNYDNDSLTRKWRYSQYTTTDIDLCDGNYSVRHYIKPVGVSGYEKEDIKKEFDMYLMGTYDANNLYFQYAQKDYDTIMASQGYDGLGFSEMYLKGWFVLYHHYFQIVNNDTGSVGGYVHIYPYDAKGENFGVEYVGETLDKDMNLDENGYSGVVNESEIGTGETIEDAFENAKPESEKGIDFTGVDEFASVLESYVGQVSNVTQGIGALFNSLPPWLLVTLAIGISLTVFLGVIKIIRG